MTQGVLAHRLSLASYTHIAKLEGGQRAPSLELVARLARLLNVSTDYLLRDTVSVDEIKILEVEPVSESISASSFGIRLKRLRQKHGLNQIEAASQFKISRAYFSNLEAGRKAPSLDLVAEIADFFNVTTDYLLHALISGEQIGS